MDGILASFVSLRELVEAYGFTAAIVVPAIGLGIGIVGLGYAHFISRYSQPGRDCGKG